MENTTVVNSKTVRQRLGSLILDIKYIDEKVFLIEKVGEDDYVGVLTSARFLRENGISIPARGKAKSEDKAEEKPDKKKK